MMKMAKVIGNGMVVMVVVVERRYDTACGEEMCSDKEKQEYTHCQFGEAAR